MNIVTDGQTDGETAVSSYHA